MANTHHSNDSRNNTNNSSSADDEVINHEQFEDMRDLLEEDFADLVQNYIADSQQRIKLLRATQVANDNANGFEAAHTLKGASANLGATQLVALSGKLQDACREHTISKQAALIEKLSVALQHVEQEINLRLSQ
ncbi:Hpt domain-containing protein [Psychrobacter sp. 72-O-c]|uniref:Hpt domain-containing protein n=1 Tax=Psychrobacter sp. 72-O-c TaxID=2774125 RepID=UPI00191B4278|nr:Hpt domain-containing protein [Psychrobacter sp. 72-O-c]